MSCYIGKSHYSVSEPATAGLLAMLLGQTKQDWSDFLIADRSNGPYGWVGNQLLLIKKYGRGRLEFRYPDYALAKFIGDRNLLALLRFVARYPRIPPVALLRGSLVSAVLGPVITADFCESVESQHRIKKLLHPHIRLTFDDITSSAIYKSIPLDHQKMHGLFLEKDGPSAMGEMFREEMDAILNMGEGHASTNAGTSPVVAEAIVLATDQSRRKQKKTVTYANREGGPIDSAVDRLKEKMSRYNGVSGAGSHDQ